MRRFLLIIFSVIISAVGLNAQYEISVKIKGLSNARIFLAYYYGDKNYVVDTLFLDQNGQGVFKKNKSLKEGLYLIVLPSRNYLDIVIDSNQRFSLEFENSSDIREMVSKLKVKGSPANQVFKDYQTFMFSRTKEILDLRITVNNKDKPEAERLKAQQKIDNLNNEIEKKQKEIVQKYPESLLAKIVRVFQDIDVPAIGTEVNDINVDSVFQYNYYKDHYFDNVDFSDERLVRTPVYHARLSQFYDRIVIPTADSIIRATELILAQINEPNELYQYTLQFVFNKYSQSKFMGHDKIMVHLADNYYLAGKTPWITDDFKKKLAERVDRVRPNLIGNMAPSLDKAQTADGAFYPLHSLNSRLTLLLFWDPDCGHCKKEIPQIMEIFHKYHQKGFNVYAFYTQNNREDWIKTIDNLHMEVWVNVYDPFYFTNFRNLYDVYSTPTVYLLDKDFRIVAKRFDISSLEAIIQEYLK